MSLDPLREFGRRACRHLDSFSRVCSILEEIMETNPRITVDSRDIAGRLTLSGVFDPPKGSVEIDGIEVSWEVHGGFVTIIGVTKSEETGLPSNISATFYRDSVMLSVEPDLTVVLDPGARAITFWRGTHLATIRCTPRIDVTASGYLDPDQLAKLRKVLPEITEAVEKLSNIIDDVLSVAKTMASLIKLARLLP